MSLIALVILKLTLIVWSLVVAGGSLLLIERRRKRKRITETMMMILMTVLLGVRSIERMTVTLTCAQGKGDWVRAARRMLLPWAYV